MHMQSFIAKPSLDQNLQRTGPILPLPALVLRRPQKPSRNRDKALLKYRSYRIFQNHCKISKNVYETF